MVHLTGKASCGRVMTSQVSLEFEICATPLEGFPALFSQTPLQVLVPVLSLEPLLSSISLV